MENIFFDLNPIYSHWKIAFTKKHDEDAGYIFESLSERRMIEIENPIPMSTYSIIKDKEQWKEPSPFDFDALSWEDDIVLGSMSFSGGITSIIISQKFKKILENFKLPKHKLYPVHLTNIYSKESQDWFLLYMPDHPIDFFNWSSCEFKLKPSFKDKNKIPVEYIGPKVVSSREEFANLRTKYRNEPIKKFLEFHKVAYNVEYDIMWGNPNTLIINSKLKQKIETENLKVEITKRKDLLEVPS